MPQDTTGSRGAIPVSAILILMVPYLWLFTGESSRGWFLYLVVIWPLLTGYWLREVWRFLSRKMDANTSRPSKAS